MKSIAKVSGCADMVRPCYTASILICGNNIRHPRICLWMWDIYSSKVGLVVHNTLTPWNRTISCRRCIYFCSIKQNLCISIQISLKYIPGSSFDNHHLIVQLRRRNIFWSNDSTNYWRICASLGLDRIEERLHAYPSGLFNWMLNMIVTLAVTNVSNIRYGPTLNKK